MILHIEHVTRYEYSARVEMAAHLLHLRPRVLPWQALRTFSLSVRTREGASPGPSRVEEGWDHFGNPLTWLFLDSAHHHLEVTTRAEVDVTPRPAPDPRATLAWEHVALMAQRPAGAREAAEFAFGSPMAPSVEAAKAWAQRSFPPRRPVLAGLLELMARLSRDFRFEPGVTTVSTPVARVLQLKAGVCQDFAHLMIAGLRGLGLPARYVSGYVRTRPPPGMARLRGADQSHAWVGCWLGPEEGWIDLDPTNNMIVSDEHVWLGWGRDYADVSPIRGVLMGGGKHTLSVSVDIEPDEERVIQSGAA